jgi:integrase
MRDVGNIVRCMLNTGIRASELRDLRWANVDLPNSRIKVDAQKTARQRSVPIGPKTCQILRAYQCSVSTSEFVFGEARGRLFMRASRQLHTVGELIGAVPISFHVLRHTFASRFMNWEGDLLTLCVILGYSTSSLDIKFSRLVHLDFETVARRLARLEEF